MTLLLMHIDRPHMDEYAAARTAVINALPKIKEQILSIRNQLRDIRQAAERADATLTEQLAVPLPSEDAFLVYRMYKISGLTQAEVALQFQQKKRKILSQATVSRMNKQVKEWLEAGNLLPKAEAPDPRKAMPVDPKTLDLGPRQDGHTPAQRGKCDSE